MQRWNQPKRKLAYVALSVLASVLQSFIVYGPPISPWKRTQTRQKTVTVLKRWKNKNGSTYIKLTLGISSYVQTLIKFGPFGFFLTNKIRLLELTTDIHRQALRLSLFRLLMYETWGYANILLIKVMYRQNLYLYLYRYQSFSLCMLH